jgi:hypothetical protein
MMKGMRRASPARVAGPSVAALLALSLLLVACDEEEKAECTADCECYARGLACQAGRCVAVGRRLYGLCGSTPTTCPCFGGTCDLRGCCVLPDQTIDDGWGPACMPPDGGPKGIGP